MTRYVSVSNGTVTLAGISWDGVTPYAPGGSVSTPFRYKDGGGISKYSGHTKSTPNIAKAGAGGAGQIIVIATY